MRTVSILPDDRVMSNRRLWTIRAVVIALLAVGVTTTATVPGVIGTIVGVFMLYWVVAWGLSTKRHKLDTTT